MDRNKRMNECDGNRLGQGRGFTRDSDAHLILLVLPLASLCLPLGKSVLFSWGTKIRINKRCERVSGWSFKHKQDELYCNLNSYYKFYSVK